MQSFPNQQKRRLQTERAEQDVAVAQAELRKSRFDTARAVSEAWIAQAVAEELRVRLRELKPATELQAAASRTALANGRTSVAEALAAQSLVARLDDRIRALDQEIESRRAELERWVGDAAGRPLAYRFALSSKLIMTRRRCSGSNKAGISALPAWLSTVTSVPV